jgi:hypothetical protein
VRGDRRKEKFTGHVPKLKRGAQVGSKQLLAIDGAKWRLGRVAAQRVCARRSQRGRLSCVRASWGPGGAGRVARGQLVAGENAGGGRWVALQRNRERKQEEEDEDLFINFCKNSRSSL